MKNLIKIYECFLTSRLIMFMGKSIYFMTFIKINKVKIQTIIVSCFSISTLKPFRIIAPAGYRLIQFKSVPNFEKIETLAIKLSRTPISFRGEIPLNHSNGDLESGVLVRVNSLEEILKPRKDKAYILPNGEMYILDNEGKQLIKIGGSGGNIDLTKYAKKPEDIDIMDPQLKAFIEEVIKE